MSLTGLKLLPGHVLFRRTHRASRGRPGPPAASPGLPRPPGASRGLPGPPGAARGRPGPPAASRGLPGLPGASQGRPGPPGASRGLPGSPAASRGPPRPPGANSQHQSTYSQHTVNIQSTSQLTSHICKGNLYVLVTGTVWPAALFKSLFFKVEKEHRAGESLSPSNQNI